MKSISLAIITTVISIFSFSQHKIYIGIEASLANDIVAIEDNGNQLKHVPLPAPLVGIKVRKEIHKHLFLEAGILYKPYDEGIGFKLEPGYSSGTGFNSWIIPFRIGSSIKLHNKKIRLVPVIGYSLCKNQDYGYDSVYAPGNGWSYTKTSNGSPNQQAKMASKGQFWSIGVELQYPLSNLWTGH